MVHCVDKKVDISSFKGQKFTYLHGHTLFNQDQGISVS